MLDPAVNTLIAVADCGSFTKAARQLYISPTAVMKQMDALESRLGLKLLERTAHGARLTVSGEIITREARAMREQVCRALAAARAAAADCEHMFCVGTSMLNPAKPFMDLWCRAGALFPDYKLHLVPFEDDSRGILAEVASLGEKFDFLVAACDSSLWLGRCRMQPLGCYKMTLTVRHSHPLAQKASLTLDDLHGCTLMMVAEGDSGVNDALRREILSSHPQIHIEDTAHFYDMSVFNRCAETDNVLLTLECWQDVHPALTTLPVSWDYKLPYGLLYAKTPPPDVQQFVDTVKDMQER